MDNNDDNDDEDEDGEEYGEWLRRERYEKIHKIETNDPTVTTLEIWEDWEVMGTAIGRNIYLQEVSAIVGNSSREILATDFRDFARGLTFNRSIQKLSIARWDHSDSEASPYFSLVAAQAWNHLTRFFVNNEALQCLDLELREIVGRSDKLCSALRRFHSLKEVKLSNYISRNNHVDYVIDALIEHHTGLTKLTIIGMDIGRTGCAALATSSLKSAKWCAY
jgi:hypothetical protein